VPKNQIWDKVTALGVESEATDLVISPTIYGERHMPSLRGTVSHITPLNTGLGSVYRALSNGVIQNLHGMMTQDFLLAAGVTRIIGCGTALCKNKVLQEQVKHMYKLPLVISEETDADAAVGAALAVIRDNGVIKDKCEGVIKDKCDGVIKDKCEGVIKDT
jgi:sedoheptulokinase